MNIELQRRRATIRQRRRREEDPWACRAASRRYYHRNPEYCKQKNREWRANNREKVAAYRQANLPHLAEIQRRVRARRKLRKAWLAWTRQLAASREARQ